MKTGAAIAGLGTAAGCLGTQGSGDGESEYSVMIEPVGTVEFESVPERWLPYTGDYADMGIALGRADGLVGIGLQSRYGTHYYDELPGVSVDLDDLTELWDDGTGKEVFYELEADVHLIDPNFMINRLGWSQDDVDEISETVAPFVGNTIFSASYDWHDYTRYTLYEAFEKVAEVFQERERYEAFERLHDDVLADVRSPTARRAARSRGSRPPPRPSRTRSIPTIEDDTQSKHWTDLRVDGALAASGVNDAGGERHHRLRDVARDRSRRHRDQTTGNGHRVGVRAGDRLVHARSQLLRANSGRSGTTALSTAA